MMGSFHVDRDVIDAYVRMLFNERPWRDAAYENEDGLWMIAPLLPGGYGHIHADDPTAIGSLVESLFYQPVNMAMNGGFSNECLLHWPSEFRWYPDPRERYKLYRAYGYGPYWDTGPAWWLNDDETLPPLDVLQAIPEIYHDWWLKQSLAAFEEGMWQYPSHRTLEQKMFKTEWNDGYRERKLVDFLSSTSPMEWCRDMAEMASAIDHVRQGTTEEKITLAVA
jgi:hypothetical protein